MMGAPLTAVTSSPQFGDNSAILSTGAGLRSPPGRAQFVSPKMVMLDQVGLMRRVPVNATLLGTPCSTVASVGGLDGELLNFQGWQAAHRASLIEGDGNSLRKQRALTYALSRTER
jgi:hypothetical protein